jgi:catalase
MTTEPIKPTTTQTGTPVASDAESLTVGTEGVTALHDRYLVEKLAQFNRERIPERIVHAKGGGAHGVFQVTGDVSAYTRAAVFQPGTTTETLQRFSSVAGEQGSPDTWRDVRGFSVKFYTTEGNYDIVGNNTPVFFIRDGIKFPDFIHSQKRLPGSGLRDDTMQWDFWTLSPESSHQVTYLMGDRGLPRSWREMPGYGSHTYQFASNQGNVEMEGSEAELIAGADADYYRRDLHDAIAAGDFPSWTVSVQIMPYEDAKTYRINPFDVTKVWPHGDYPRIEVGVHTLNRNPQNFFAEIEQAAFSPANFVPGIAASPDKMLMARIFSYPDAQRYRVGTNFAELPVNAPHAAPVNSYSQDGAARHQFNAPEAPNYAPNSLGGPVADPLLAGEGSWENDGALLRAAALLRSDDAAKARFLDTITGAISGVKRPEVTERAIGYWTSVDAELGAALRVNLAAWAEADMLAEASAEYSN